MFKLEGDRILFAADMAGTLLFATTKSEVVKAHTKFECPSEMPLCLHVRSDEILTVGTGQLSVR